MTNERRRPAGRSRTAVMSGPAGTRPAGRSTDHEDGRSADGRSGDRRAGGGRAGGGQSGGGQSGRGSGGGRRGRRYAAQPEKKALWRRILNWKTFVFVPLGLFLLGVIGIAVVYAMTPIPDPHDETRFQASIVYWNDGETEMHRFSEQNREVISISEVPEHVRNAVLAAEDRTFYEHSGFDPVGIGRAAYNNLTGGTGGGSTVTQQYVKNFYLTTEQTLSRKVEELFISIKVDQQLSKDQILEDYLNTIWWGRGTLHGIQTAARSYFGKPASELTLEEGAALAAIIQSPGKLDPANEDNVERFESRYRWVLDGMVVMGVLDQATADAAEVPEVLPQKSGNTLGGPNGYLVDLVERELAEAGLTEQEIKTGGLRIVTTFDQEKQQAAIDAVEEEFPRGDDGELYEDLHMGLAAVQPGTGEVVAAYGGHDYVERPFNDVTTQVQGGSTLKPFGLAKAFEDNISLESRFHGTSPLDDPAIGPAVNNQGTYSWPGGDVDLLNATKRSLNTAFVDLSYQLGYQRVDEAFFRAGIPGYDESPGLAAAGARNIIGIWNVSPMDLANAYGTLADGGRRSEVHTVRRVTAPSGEVRYEGNTESERAFDAEIAAEVTYALTEVVEDGTGTEAKALGRPAAGKTGTHEDITGWFAGYTPQLAATVMFYYQDGSNSTSLRGIVGDDPNAPFHGGVVPARIWTTFMDAALAGEPVLDFPPRPEIGDPVNPTPTPTAEPTCPPGTEGTAPDCEVIPTAEPTCPPGTEGTPPDCTPLISVPDVVGQSVDAAVAELQRAGLRANVRGGGRDGDRFVVSQNPAPGSEVRRDSTVDLEVQRREPEPTEEPTPTPEPPPTTEPDPDPPDCTGPPSDRPPECDSDEDESSGDD